MRLEASKRARLELGTVKPPVDSACVQRLIISDDLNSQQLTWPGSHDRLTFAVSLAHCQQTYGTSMRSSLGRSCTKLRYGAGVFVSLSGVTHVSVLVAAAIFFTSALASDISSPALWDSRMPATGGQPDSLCSLRVFLVMTYLRHNTPPLFSVAMPSTMFFHQIK